MMIHVNINERAVLHANGKPVRWLRPGRHLVVNPFVSHQVVKLNIDAITAELRPEQAAVAPHDELETIIVQTHERALVSVAGKPMKWLGPGRHYVFRADPALRVALIDTRAVDVTPLDPQVRRIVPPADYTEVQVSEGAVAVRFVDGVLDAVLAPGRHASWTTVHAVNLAVLDGRERVLNIAGQEVMTKDRVSLRITISLVVRMTDPRKLATVAQNADEVLYLQAQLAMRDAVTTRTLDALLAAREQLADELRGPVAARAAELGLSVDSVGIKDVVLPGEMKELLNKVIEAQKAAEANVIMRREETAATRSLAQTAQILTENPVLMRLKELEAYKDLAQKVGKVHLVMGEQALPMLQLKAR